MRELFNGIASDYDRMNEALSLGKNRAIKEHAIDHLIIDPGSAILDVCTGSGDIAIFIAKKFPSCRIVGIDASEKMIALARQRAKDFPNITFEIGSALHLPFDNHMFDRTVISFGLRNVADLGQCLSEMKRVTKQGGFVSSLDCGKPQNTMIKVFHALYLSSVIPLLGKILFHPTGYNSFAYLQKSQKYFPHQHELCTIFERIGLEQVMNYDFILGAVAQQVGRVCKV